MDALTPLYCRIEQPELPDEVLIHKCSVQSIGSAHMLDWVWFRKRPVLKHFVHVSLAPPIPIGYIFPKWGPEHARTVKPGYLELFGEADMPEAIITPMEKRSSILPVIFPHPLLAQLRVPAFGGNWSEGPFDWIANIYVMNEPANPYDILFSQRPQRSVDWSHFRWK
jgi:hypothetical protein